jgi:hypothetical protein
VRAIPTTIIILEDRSQYHRNKGYRPGDEVLLRKQLQSLVESRPAGEGGAAGEGGTESAGAGAEASGEAGPAGKGKTAIETAPEPPAEAGD